MASEFIRQQVYESILFDLKALSNCISRQTSAILVDNNMIILTGYNGTSMGVENCNQGGCKRCSNKNKESGKELESCICLHSEQNIITLAARKGISTNGCILYCSHKPCLTCQKLLINCGIKQIYYFEDYPSEINEELLKVITLTKLNSIRHDF